METIRAYDVVKRNKDGEPGKSLIRTTYLIDENGMIEKAMPKVKPDDNATEILSYLRGK